MIYNPFHLRAYAGDRTVLEDAASLLGKGIRTQDLDRLKGILDDKVADPSATENYRRLAAGMALFKTEIESGIGGKSEEGAARYLNYMHDVRTAYEKGISEGKTVASMLNPGPIDNPNPDYILNPENYLRTRREKFNERRIRREKDRAKDEENAARAARPDMSPSDYLKSIEK